MLAFIDDHYQERLNLTEIAHAAHVGRSECSRCFQKTLATLPTLLTRVPVGKSG